MYGGTYRLLSKVFVPWGVGLDVVDITDLKAVETALASKHYQYVWIETPSNPLLNITDIAVTTEVAHKYGTKVAVDNTFASPALQHPLADGADVVVYSTTKYIGGHSDVVGGAVVVNDEETREKVAFLQNAAGAVPSRSTPAGHPRPEDPGSARQAPQCQRPEGGRMARIPAL